jgi:RNA recognition motif. (a.k.a. RRM, RBD, or RNP domain)
MGSIYMKLESRINNLGCSQPPIASKLRPSPTMSTPSDQRWDACVLTLLDGMVDKGSRSPVKVKQLRKLALLSMQLGEDDKPGKKQFKQSVQRLELEGELALDSNGDVTRSKSKSKKTKKRQAKSDQETDVKSKKKTRPEVNTGIDSEADMNPSKIVDDCNLDEEQKSAVGKSDSAVIVTAMDDKNKSCKGNPQGVTRLFVGNLPFSVDETTLGEFLVNAVTHIKWITDKETGKFYGSAFVEMSDSAAAAAAVAKAGSALLGRQIKVNFAPSRPGDVWPPTRKVVSGGGAGGAGGGPAGTGPGKGGQAGGFGIKAMSEKPEDCCKLFIGNLSYEIDDDGIVSVAHSICSAIGRNFLLASSFSFALSLVQVFRQRRCRSEGCALDSPQGYW